MTDNWRADFADTPPFAHLRPWATTLSGAGWPSPTQLNRLAQERGLRNSRGLPIRFQAQHQRCGQRDYEAGILATGEIPTRVNNWHDLLNALTWLAFPKTKAALNAVQCRSLGIATARGPESDAATLFDESGLVLVGPDDTLTDLLAAKRWRAAFIERRGEWKGLRLFIIGHAVLEKLLTPWPGITAKCLFLRMEDGQADESEASALVDEAVAATWRNGGVPRPAELFPMPVLGVPGWWPDNECPTFYDNREIFRPPRA